MTKNETHFKTSYIMFDVLETFCFMVGSLNENYLSIECLNLNGLGPITYQRCADKLNTVRKGGMIFRVRSIGVLQDRWTPKIRIQFLNLFSY